jgi:hypothetical protein
MGVSTDGADAGDRGCDARCGALSAIDNSDFSNLQIWPRIKHNSTQVTFDTYGHLFAAMEMTRKRCPRWKRNS